MLRTKGLLISAVVFLVIIAALTPDLDLMRRALARLNLLSKSTMASSSTSATQGTSKPKLNVHKFPRPPLCELTPRHLRITWNDEVVADTTSAYWVLETTHPPTYYLPPSSLSTSTVTLSTVPKYRTMCEWKGAATYHNLKLNSTGDEIKKKIWSYESPTPRFEGIKDYLCFYASGVPWKCFVDGEEVKPQDGDFYGGWVTSELEGPMKGGPGTWGW